jgi:hypothetical protein
MDAHFRGHDNFLFKLSHYQAQAEFVSLPALYYFAGKPQLTNIYKESESS